MEDKRAVLVYQCGIANIFEVDCFNMAPFGRNAKRLLQSDFHSRTCFARGLKHAGYIVKVAGCNMAGDIAEQKWTDNLEELPFSDKFVLVSDTNNLL